MTATGERRPVESNSFFSDSEEELPNHSTSPARSSTSGSPIFGRFCRAQHSREQSENLKQSISRGSPKLHRNQQESLPTSPGLSQAQLDAIAASTASDNLSEDVTEVPTTLPSINEFEDSSRHDSSNRHDTDSGDHCLDFVLDSPVLQPEEFSGTGETFEFSSPGLEEVYVPQQQSFPESVCRADELEQKAKNEVADDVQHLRDTVEELSAALAESRRQRSREESQHREELEATFQLEEARWRAEVESLQRQLRELRPSVCEQHVESSRTSCQLNGPHSRPSTSLFRNLADEFQAASGPLSSTLPLVSNSLAADSSLSVSRGCPSDIQPGHGDVLLRCTTASPDASFPCTPEQAGLEVWLRSLSDGYSARDRATSSTTPPSLHVWPPAAQERRAQPLPSEALASTLGDEPCSPEEEEFLARLASPYGWGTSSSRSAAVADDPCHAEWPTATATASAGHYELEACSTVAMLQSDKLPSALLPCPVPTSSPWQQSSCSEWLAGEAEASAEDHKAQVDTLVVSAGAWSFGMCDIDEDVC